MQNFKLPSAWIPAIAGLILIILAARTGMFAALLAAIPAALIITGGTRSLLFPDLRGPQQVAIGAVLALLLALPLGLAGGGNLGLATLALSIIAFLAGGWCQIRLQPAVEGVPAPGPTLGYSAQVALDDAMLGLMAFLTPLSTPSALRESVRESEATHAIFSDLGYLEEPVKFHATPPEVTSFDLLPMRIGGYDCEHLRFDSGFEPDGRLPGRDRWLSYEQNRTTHAWILRHRQPAPWLVCVHGFGMGNPKQDFRMFKAGRLHERAGVNIALFALPVHGPRSPGGFNGGKFFSLSVVDFIHAEAQAIWDLRRLIAWLRKQDATAIGIYGISLGGYTSALLSGIEKDLACVIAAIPPTDMMAHREYLVSTTEKRLSAIAGVDMIRDRAVTSVISPLEFPPLVPRDGRFIFGATGDQFVPIEQVHALWRHWDQPRITWATSGHVSALKQPGLTALVDEALDSSIKQLAVRGA